MYRILFISIALLFGPCGGGKKRPPPIPPATPTPTVEPTPQPTLEPTPIASPTATPAPSPSPSASASPSAFPTPFPTPQFDPLTYIPAIPVGKTVTVSGENLSEKLQTAQDDPEVVSVRVEGGGSFTKQVVLRKHTSFDSSTYSADMQGQTDQGQFLIADGVLVEGTWRIPQVVIDYFKFGNGRDWQDPYLLKVQALTAEQLAGTGTTIVEPNYVADWAPIPAIEVFQALGDTTGSHTDKAHDIAVIGFHIKGRQKVYDGGVRSTSLLGNCVRCTAQNNYLEDTAGIGILFGGSALEKDNYSDRGLIWHNVASGVAAANLAAINSENLIVAENYVRRPGHHDPVFGGGVCGFDLETNTNADHTKNIQVFNNLLDFEGSALAGNALCLQDPYYGTSHAPGFAANNIAIGGRSEHSDNRYMTNGIFLNGLKGWQVINNYVFRTGQNALQTYGIENCLIQDNDFESTGGGGNSTILNNGAKNTTFRRNNYRDRPGVTINTQAGMIDRCGSGNKYEENRTLGEVTLPILVECPSQQKRPR